MKVQFWSPLHGQGRTTSNLLAIALFGVLGYNLDTFVCQAHFRQNNFEAPLIGKTSNKEYESLYYDGIGIDALTRALKSAKLNEEDFHNCSISLMKNKLNLLSGTKQKSLEIFNRDMENSIATILHSADNFYDLVLVDTNSGNNKLAKIISEECDVICVNLSQNDLLLDSYFRGDYQFDSDKTLFLIGAYDEDSKYSLTNLRKKYPEMKKSNTACIPYNIGYSDAMSEGNLMAFITQNINADMNNKHKEFIVSLEDATKKILKIGGLERKKNGLFD